VGPDLAVLAQDPRFGGGGVALTDAFVRAARTVGREPQLLYDVHPGLGEARLTWRRVEALRQLAATGRLAREAREARSLWVAASLAHHGAAAPRTGRRYGCWLATTLDAEWRGRAPGLPAARRFAASVSIPTLKRLERRVLSQAHVLYATSPASCADLAAAAGRPQTDVRLLRIPVDVERFSPAPEREWRALVESPVLAFVGRATDPRKNLPLLLEAFELLLRALPTARLLLVGGPPRSPAPAGVEVVGPVADVAAELRRAAVFALPSRQEGFGIVAAEALAAGVPVVSTPCGGPEELITRSGGGVVTETFDPEEFATTIERLVRDPDALSAMRDAGRDYVARVHAPALFQELVANALMEIDGD